MGNLVAFQCGYRTRARTYFPIERRLSRQAECTPQLGFELIQRLSCIRASALRYQSCFKLMTAEGERPRLSVHSGDTLIRGKHFCSL